MVFCITILNAQQKSNIIIKYPRVGKIINSDWLFNYYPKETANKGYESLALDDSRWSAVSIPHTWNTFETTGEFEPYYENTDENDNTYWWIGWGWYRKHFSLNNIYTGRKVFIRFDGVQNYCKVWLNGNYLGEHKGGSNAFCFDISAQVKYGEDNVVAVAVNNPPSGVITLPLTVKDKYKFYGGIFRDVSLIIQNKLYIPLQGLSDQEGGTFITTPKASEKDGIVRIQTWVKNDNTEKKNCTLRSTIFDASGKVVQVIKTDAVINPGQLFRFEQVGKPVLNPNLWSPENPYLYKIFSEVIDGKQLQDELTSLFGFRRFRWDSKENLLYLNNNKIALQGGLFQIEYPWLGNAIPVWISEKDIREQKEILQNNYVKISNYTKIVELASQSGMIIEMVSSGQGSIGENQQNLIQMVRSFRNNPAIVFWNSGDNFDKDADSKSVIAEDTTRIFNTALSPSVSRSGNIKGGLNKIVDNATNAGDPSKIVLTVSHKSVEADRGTVVVMSAHFVDSKGNHVRGVTKTLKWFVSGPAKLIGPDIFETEDVKQGGREILRYKELPVSNMIRSTGKPGKITVRVSASGLESGVADIETKSPERDNSIIQETALNNENRLPVARKKMGFTRLEEVPAEIAMTKDDINFSPGGKTAHKKLIKDHIYSKNKTVDTTSVEFKTLADLFAYQLFNNSGRISADDYNFNADHFNNCRLIAGYITATKLPPLFKETLREYYANSIIKQGNVKDAGDEMNWLNWIPSGGTVVINNDGGRLPAVKGAVMTDKTELSDLISVVHPTFSKFSDEAKDRALTFISNMNPYIHARSAGNGINETTPIVYEAEKGKPVLIPLLKFIAE